MIRRFLFILFLYVLLVWLVAALFYSVDSKPFLDHGILWTAMGIGVLLVGLVVERVFAWRRTRSAAEKVSPETPAVTARAIHEDDAALANLLREADDRLAKAPDLSATGSTRVRDLPLYLVIGPEGTGKTALIQNSGMEPSLLAGQVSGAGAAITSTRIANVWFARRSVFLEISGRVFSSEPSRLSEFISVLTPGGNSRGWSSWFEVFRKPVSLRSVLLCIDCRDFAGTPEPSVLDRAAQKIRERLLAISNVLGAEFPVYVILTKLDGLPYFGEYFARLTDDESGQVFGVLRSENAIDANENRVWAEAETKRLNKAFQSLFGRLSDRRLLALTVEPDSSNKPAIYEFPREFKRIRTSMVQFLVDVFKPDPLKVSPRLRGLFFTGTKRVERLADPADAKSTYVSQRPSGDATHFFRTGGRVSAGDPSTVFGKVAGSGSAGQLMDRWVFLTEFFHSVLSSDRPTVVRVTRRTRFDSFRKYAAGGAVAFSALLILVWTISWIGNWRLSSEVERAVSAVQRGNGGLNLSNLQSLDALRAELEKLDGDDSLSLHWGLSQGDALRDVAQRVYFERLRRLSLDFINQALAAHLQRAALEAQPAGITYDRLKTHRTITTLGCPVDSALVGRVLKATSTEIYPGLAGDQMGLLQNQLEFYTKQLEHSKKQQPPVRLTENLKAVEEARRYLSNAGGIEQQLRFILSQLNQQIKPVSMAETAEDYRSVLTGNPDFQGAFTKRGYDLFDDLAAKAGSSGGEACVMGTRDRFESALSRVDSRARDRLKSLYLRQYADAWKEFLVSYSVIPYSDARDASMRLRVLSASRSPLLSLVKLIAVNTNFPPAKPGEVGFWEKGAQALGLNRALDAKTKGEKALAVAKPLADNDSRLMTPSDLARLFQPALFTAPPEADVLVNDHDGPYVEGLRKLQTGLENLVQASASEKPVAISQARAALGQARMAHAGLADKFNNVGNEGLSKQLADLLEQPIRLADRPSIIPPNGDVSTAATKNGELAAFCRDDLAPILKKYPFNPTSTNDASTMDLSNGFAPSIGKVWKYALGKGADLVVRSGPNWDRNPSWQGPRVTQDLVGFLNQAQRLTNALFTEAGMLQPKLKYTLRPSGSVPIRIVLDGTEIRSSQSSFQKPFYWPAQGSDKPGAEGSVDVAGGAGFGRFDGLWGVFHLFQNADERALGQTAVQWSANRGRGGAVLQPISPPAKVEFVEFPGGVDLFNPKFFEALTCPGRAVTVN